MMDVDVSAKTLALDVIKRGARVHVSQVDALIRAAERVRRSAAYTETTGKVFHDDAKAHTALKKAYRRLIALEDL